MVLLYNMHYMAFGLSFSDCPPFGVMLQPVKSKDFLATPPLTDLFSVATFLMPSLMVISFGVLCQKEKKKKKGVDKL